MPEVWGVPVGVFLVGLIVLLVVTGIAALMPRYVLDRRAERVAAGAPCTPSADELALLAGGRERLVHAVIARLLDGGVLRVSREGGLGATGENPRGARLDESVVAAVTSRSTATVDDVVGRVSDGPAVREVEARLRASGLLHDATTARWLRLLAPAAPAAVLVVGLVPVVLELSGGPMVGTLIGGGLFGFFVVAWTRMFGSDDTATSAPGRQVVKSRYIRLTDARWGREKVLGPGAVTSGVLADPDAAELVALRGGLSAYPDPEVARVLGASSSISRRSYRGSGGGGVGGGGGGCGGGGGGC